MRGDSSTAGPDIGSSTSTDSTRQIPPAPAVRLGPWLVAIVLIVGGLAIGWLPGPGGFIAIFGLAIVAMEFRFVAVGLDRMERLGRDAWAWLRGKKKPARRDSPKSAD